MNLFFLITLACFSAACAGNPPAWWTPSNAYSADGVRASSSYNTNAAEQTAVISQPEEMPIPQEVDIAPLPDESYEEMILTPLQDEETENDSGESSAQSAPTETGLLPPPSVLE